MKYSDKKFMLLGIFDKQNEYGRPYESHHKNFSYTANKSIKLLINCLMFILMHHRANDIYPFQGLVETLGGYNGN